MSNSANQIETAFIEKESGLSAIAVATKPISGISTLAVTNKPVITTPVGSNITIKNTTTRYDYLASNKVYLKAPYFPLVKAVNTIEPVSSDKEPIIVGDYILFPDDKHKKLNFILRMPNLLDFSLTIFNEEKGGTIKTKSGKATLVFGLFKEKSLEELERLRSHALLRDYVNWKFCHLSIGQLQASLLQLGEGIQNVTTNISTNVGTLIFNVDLNNLGAEIWEEHVRSQKMRFFHGVCEAKLQYYARQNDRDIMKDITLSGPLNILLAGVKQDAVCEINPARTLVAKVIVQPQSLVQSILVECKPSHGHQPETRSFDNKGGTVEFIITDTNLEDLKIDLQYHITFNEPSWPIIKKRKTLTYQGQEWIDVIDPDDWLDKYLLTVLLLDPNDKVVEQEAEADRVICELAYQSPQLNGGQPIHAVIHTTSRALQTVNFPLPEGNTPGKLKLTVTAFRTLNGEVIPPRPQVRELTNTTSVVTVTVDKFGISNILSNSDSVSESSIEGNYMAILEQLKPTKNGLTTETGIYPSTETNPAFTRLLQYLNTNEFDFYPYEELYFMALEENLIFHNVLNAYGTIDRNNFNNAVAEFQRRNNLTQDGIPGEKTLWALQVPFALANQYNIVQVAADQPTGFTGGYNRFSIRDDISFYYEGLREEVLRLGGVLTSSGALRSLDAEVHEGRSSKSMHYTGLAFDLYIYSGMQNPDRDPFVIVEEDGKWVVYCRAASGAEHTLDAMVFKNGKTQTQRVSARFINFTELAAEFGFKGISARSCFPRNYLCAEWWHFQNEYVLTPYFSQFGIEVLRRSDVTLSQLMNSPLWSNRMKILKKDWF